MRKCSVGAAKDSQYREISIVYEELTKPNNSTNWYNYDIELWFIFPNTQDIITLNIIWHIIQSKKINHLSSY